MKRSIIFTIISLVLSHQLFSQNDQDAIKSVCSGETRAYLDHDYDAWAGFHAQTPEDQLSWNNPDGTYGSISGWSALSKDAKEWYKGGKKTDPTVFENTDFTFVIRGELAYVAYSAARKDGEGKTMKTREHRTLLKMNGQWKILAVQAFINYKVE